MDMPKCVSSRLIEVSKLPKVFINTARDGGKTVLGIAATALAIATLGTQVEINEYAKKSCSAEKILPRFFKASLRVINPESKMGSGKYIEPFYTSKFAVKMLDKAEEYSRSSTFLTKQLTSRAMFVISIPVGIACKVGDLALGIFYAIGAFVTGGNFPTLNELACKHLESLDVIGLVSNALIKAVNPQKAERPIVSV